jgi:predicted NBD/HSP70 family sugar kinase
VVALPRVEAALRGEAWAGAAGGTFDAIYVSLVDGPAAAILANGRILVGASHRAGGLPAFPLLETAQPLAGEDLEQAAALLADIAVLIDPSVVVVHGSPEHVTPLLPVLQRVLDQVLPGAHVAPASLGEKAAVLGAMRAASIVAYEGRRFDDES